jgi:hypothetical protein
LIHRFFPILFLVLATASLAQSVPAQQSDAPAPQAQPAASAPVPDAPSPAQQPAQPTTAPFSRDRQYEGKQTKRILWIVPNFRSVSVDEKLPPLSVHEKFKLTMNDNFDYSNFIYVGILAADGQIQNSYPEFHEGAPAFARYYWHTFADTVDGNLMTEFLLPIATREDPRYYTLGRNGKGHRSIYAISRLFVTRTDGGGEAPNFSEIVGNGAAAGIACLYYPQQERTWTKTGQRWVTQVGLDGFSNLVEEFWPDWNARLFHNKY